MDDGRRRKPDEDLVDYLSYNRDLFDLTDIYNIYAEIAGHNDEDHWFWVLELRDGRFVLTSAWCDYTGWDCQSGGESKVAETALAAAELAPEEDSGRKIRWNLVAQITGEQPFGLETRSF